MNGQEIIEMARQSGARQSSNPDEYDVLKITDRSLEAFAKLVAAKKQEQCAQFCEQQYEYYGHDHVFAAGIRALK